MHAWEGDCETARLEDWKTGALKAESGAASPVGSPVGTPPRPLPQCNSTAAIVKLYMVGRPDRKLSCKRAHHQKGELDAVARASGWAGWTSMSSVGEGSTKHAWGEYQACMGEGGEPSCRGLAWSGKVK